MVGDAVALVGRAEPQIVAAVLEDGVDFALRNVVGEVGLSLAEETSAGRKVAENAFSNDIQQDAAVIEGVHQVDVSVGQDGIAPYGLRQFCPGSFDSVVDPQVPHSGKPDLPAACMTDMVGGEGDGDRGLRRKVATVVAGERISARDDP